MALVVYMYDQITRRFRSPGGPDLVPPNQTGTTGWGTASYGMSPYGQ